MRHALAAEPPQWQAKLQKHSETHGLVYPSRSLERDDPIAPPLFDPALSRLRNQASMLTDPDLAFGRCSKAATPSRRIRRAGSPPLQAQGRGTSFRAWRLTGPSHAIFARAIRLGEFQKGLAADGIIFRLVAAGK